MNEWPLGENLEELKKEANGTTEDWEADLRDLILSVKRKNDRILYLLILVIILQGAFLVLVADHALI